MPNISRRHFLRNASIGAAATGVAAAGGLNLLTGVSSADAATLAEIHHLAHEACFIANSVKTEVIVEPR